MNKFFTVVLALVFIAVCSVVIVADVHAADYIGAKKCKACHLKQYKAWEKTSSKDYTADPNCLKCHTTGYGKPGGFTSLDETPKLTGVQCEGCHGPGSEYVKIMKKDKKYKFADVKALGLIRPSEDEKGCMVCHGADSPFTEKVDARYKWEFKERLERTHKHFPLKYAH